MKTTKHKPKQTQFNACITGVNPIRSHGFGVYSGARKVWGVRVDETLLKEAKPLMRAKYGSDCRAVEVWLAGLVSIAKGEQLNGVNPSNTVEIGTLVIERNIRTRRKLVVEEEEVVEKIVTRKCFVCGRAAVGEAVHESGKQVLACKKHLAELKAHPQWTVISVE